MEPPLAHFGVHARLLLAVQLRILAEGTAQAMVGRLLRLFVDAGVIAPPPRSACDAAIVRSARLRDPTPPWIAILAGVVTYVSESEVIEPSHEVDRGTRGHGQSGGGALWHLHAGRAIFLTFALAWLWRVVLSGVLFRRLSGFDLALVPTHPYRLGGLGFLERLPTVFAPIVLAIGAVLASRWGHDAMHHGLDLKTMRIEVVAVDLGQVLPRAAAGLRRTTEAVEAAGAARLRRPGRATWPAGATALDRRPRRRRTGDPRRTGPGAPWPARRPPARQCARCVPCRWARLRCCRCWRPRCRRSPSCRRCRFR